MKLRNKKTGEVVDLSIFGIELNIRKENQPIYHSIAELNEEWEDYKSTGPLITGDDARDAVLSWASTLAIHEVRCKKTEKGVAEVITFEAYKLGSAPRIEFASWSLDADVTDGAIYTIAELCGEEEEE